MNNIQLVQKRRSLLYALCCAALCCCSLAVLSPPVHAQTITCDSCSVPTDDANNVGGTAGVPWTGGSIDTTIFGCAVQICYGCRQTSPVNFDYVVTQICVDSACFYNNAHLIGMPPHPDTNWDDWTAQATFELFAKNPCHFPCPSCPGNGQAFWQENYITCYQVTASHNPSTGVTTYHHKMCDEHGWCIRKYEVCCDETGFHHTLKKSQRVDYTCPGPCHNMDCPPPWPDN
jgi:hypothetical protein